MCNLYSIIDSRCLRKSYVRLTELMEKCSLVEWTSKRSGPSDTLSMPGTMLFITPHSRPAWIAVTTAFLPVLSSYAFAQNFASLESGSGVQDVLCRIYVASYANLHVELTVYDTSYGEVVRCLNHSRKCFAHCKYTMRGREQGLCNRE